MAWSENLTSADALRSLSNAQYSDSNKAVCVDTAAKLDSLEGGLLLLLDAVKAGDPKDELIWRIEEELRQIRRRK